MSKAKKRTREVTKEPCPYCGVKPGFPCLNYQRKPKQPCQLPGDQEQEQEPAAFCQLELPPKGTRCATCEVRAKLMVRDGNLYLCRACWREARRPAHAPNP